LQTLGVEKVGGMVGHGIKLAGTAAEAFRELEGWEIVSPAQLAVLNIRYVPSLVDGEKKSMVDEKLSERVNMEISKRAVARNVAVCLTTTLYGRLCMRMCTISPELEIEEMRKVVGELDELAKEVVRELQNGA
jgi:L-2,4-diaminobutyrate decarboxylase